MATDDERAMTAGDPGTNPTGGDRTQGDRVEDAKGGATSGQPVVSAAGAWRRLQRMSRPRLTRANVLVLILAVSLGLAIGAQVQLTQERGLGQLTQNELVRVLDDVSARSDRLDGQLRELESARDRLQSGTGNRAEALAAAQKRLDTLGILAGTVGVQGPGITFTISSVPGVVTAPMVVDLVMELRDAGAEAIDIGGVRVVAQSYVGSENGDVTVDGVPVPTPIVVKAIGDKATLASALKIPGGVQDTLKQKGASGLIEESDSLRITSLHAVTQFNTARPAE